MAVRIPAHSSWFFRTGEDGCKERQIGEEDYERKSDLEKRCDVDSSRDGDGGDSGGGRWLMDGDGGWLDADGGWSEVMAMSEVRRWLWEVGIEDRNERE